MLLAVLLAGEQHSLFILKAVFFYALLSICVISWAILKIYEKIAALISDNARRYEDTEKLLLDIRDGTRTFFKEKRSSARIENNITAKLKKPGWPEESIRVLNGSEGGALFACQKKPEAGEVIELIMYLPLFPQPIEAKAKVVRVKSAGHKERGKYYVGVEFLSMSGPDRQRFAETINVLKKNIVK